MNRALKTYIQLVACMALAVSCSRQDKPQDIPLDIDQAMELYGVPVSSPAPVDPNRVLIKVNDHTITQRELKAEMVKLLRSVDVKKIPPEQLQQVQQQISVQAQKNLIQQKVLLTAVENSSIIAPSSEIDEFIVTFKKTLPEDLSFEQFLEERKITMDDFTASIESEIKVRKLLESQVSKSIPPTPADIRTFYNENSDQFNIPEQVAARHILLKLPANATGQEFIEKKKKIGELHKRLQEGEKFEGLIAAESEDPSADGSLGVLKKGTTLPVIEGPLFALQPGEFTEPIKTEHGFHIIQAQKKFPAKVISFEEAMPKISNFLTQQAQQKTVADYVNSLMKEAKIEQVADKP